MPKDLDLEVASRLSTHETKIEHLAEEVGKHESLISEMKEKMSTLVTEVKQIRNALYFMAAALAANVPAFNSLLEIIKHFLGFA